MAKPPLMEISLGGSGVAKPMHRTLGLLRKAVGDMRPIWKDVVHPYFIVHMAMQFWSGGRHGGKPWAKYQAEPKYRAFKKAVVGHLKPLLWIPGRERLRPSFVSMGHPEHVYSHSPDKVTIGSKVPYAGDIARNTKGLFGEPSPARHVTAMEGKQRTKLVNNVMQGIRRTIGSDGMRKAKVNL